MLRLKKNCIRKVDDWLSALKLNSNSNSPLKWLPTKLISALSTIAVLKETQLFSANLAPLKETSLPLGSSRFF